MPSTSTIDGEIRALASDALAFERRDLIEQLHGIVGSVESYKAHAAEAAEHGLPVPFTDTMRGAMTEAVDALVELNANAGEWSR